MSSASEISTPGITLEPCQICHQVKPKFYLCNRNHTTCDDCKTISNGGVAESQLTPLTKRVTFSLPLTPDSEPTSPLRPPLPPPRSGSLSPSSALAVPIPAAGRGVESPSPSMSRASPCRLASGSPPSNFSFRSPIKSLVIVPKANEMTQRDEVRSPEPPEISEESYLRNYRKSSGRKSPPPSLPPPRIIEEDLSDDSEIFCRACDALVEATHISLSVKMAESLMKARTELSEAADGTTEELEDFSAGDANVVPSASGELLDNDTLKQDVALLREGLVTAYNELMITRENLDEVIYATEKLEIDVEMLRGGVNYVYFDFDTVSKRREVRVVETICGIPFELMVRMRVVARVPHLGFFIGLDRYGGREHSPLKKIIVLRAHNAYGKVIEKHTLKTFENGECVHSCFDLRIRSTDNGMWGYVNFLKRDRILKPDMLKDGRLCLSLQIKPLEKM